MISVMKVKSFFVTFILRNVDEGVTAELFHSFVHGEVCRTASLDLVPSWQARLGTPVRAMSTRSSEEQSLERKDEE